jgi:hypothetical protein
MCGSMKKLALLLALAALPFAGTYVYFTIFREYYFPSRYEDGFQALFIAAVTSFAILVLVGAHYLALLFRANPKT